MLKIRLLTEFNFQTKFCFLCVFAKIHFKFNLGSSFSCFDQKWLKYSLESKKVNQSHIALWSQWCYGMCTYVIWEEFWKGIELPVSPLISDCSLCKREPWHLCKGSRGLSLVSRNQFELSLLEIYIFRSACAFQLVFLDLWLISCRHCVSKRQLHCTEPPLNTHTRYSRAAN